MFQSRRDDLLRNWLILSPCSSSNRVSDQLICRRSFSFWHWRGFKGTGSEDSNGFQLVGCRDWVDLDFDNGRGHSIFSFPSLDWDRTALEKILKAYSLEGSRYCVQNHILPSFQERCVTVLIAILFTFQWKERSFSLGALDIQIA